VAGNSFSFFSVFVFGKEALGVLALTFVEGTFIDILHRHGVYGLQRDAGDIQQSLFSACSYSVCTDTGRAPASSMRFPVMIVSLAVRSQLRGSTPCRGTGGYPMLTSPDFGSSRLPTLHPRAAGRHS